jgi:hypothetical protein
MESMKFPASPGTPLFPLSPERVNGTRLPYNGQALQSPSMPEFGKPSLTVDPFALTSKSPKSPYRHSRNNSDALVQGMIARFDNLSVKDLRANHEVAIKRVEIAREMAEIESKNLKEQMATKDDDAKKLREEGRKLKKELDEARERERKVVRRMDVVMVRCNALFEKILLLTCNRKNCTEPKKHTIIQLPFTKKKSGVPERKPSSPHRVWSRCRKNSRLRATVLR